MRLVPPAMQIVPQRFLGTRAGKKQRRNNAAREAIMARFKQDHDVERLAERWRAAALPDRLFPLATPLSSLDLLRAR